MFKFEDLNNKKPFNDKKYLIVYVLSIVFAVFIILSIILQISNLPKMSDEAEKLKIGAFCITKVCINNEYCFDSFLKPEEVIIYKEFERGKNSNIWVINIVTTHKECFKGVN